MVNNHALKKNQSSLNVLETLKVLLESEYTMSQLLERLNKNNSSTIFNSNVVSKYINTCRYCGINIPKTQNKYIITSIPFGIDINDKDISNINKLFSVVRNSFSNNVIFSFEKLFAKINKFSNKQIVNYFSEIISLNCNKFNKAIDEKRKVKLFLSNGSEIIGDPINIVKNAERTFFNIWYEKKEKLVCINKVNIVEVLNDRVFSNYSETTVLFKLRGELAKRYSLREYEIMEFCDEPNTILIANRGEHKEILFSRLLRYDSCCEIISPKSYREEMKQLLNKMILNYEG